jgi:hypothetical protein
MFVCVEPKTVVGKTKVEVLIDEPVVSDKKCVL